MIVHLAKRELRDRSPDLFFLVIPFPQPLRGPCRVAGREGALFTVEKREGNRRKLLAPRDLPPWPDTVTQQPGGERVVNRRGTAAGSMMLFLFSTSLRGTPGTFSS